jgi:hypothetical protein
MIDPGEGRMICANVRARKVCSGLLNRWKKEKSEIHLISLDVEISLGRVRGERMLPVRNFMGQMRSSLYSL